MAEPTIDFQKYLRLIRKVRSGEALNKQELAFVVEFKQDVDTGALDKIKDRDAYKKLTPEEQGELSQEALDASTKLLFQDPTYKEDLISLAKDAEQGKVSEKIATGLNIALAGTDIITSIGQIRGAKDAAKRSRRPSRPAPLTASPELQNAIVQAQQGNFDAVRALAPAQLAILDNYLSDINQARTASTGQAGNFGALAQVASGRRNRASAQLAPIADTITARNQSRLDNLLGLKLQENQAIQQSGAQFYPTDIQQYQFDQVAAQNDRVAGQQNLRSSLTGLGSQLPQLLSELAVKKKYDDIYNTMSQYGTEVGEMAAKTNLENRERMNGRKMTQLADPQYLDQLYGAG
jgi:hypothetical protein